MTDSIRRIVVVVIHGNHNVTSRIIIEHIAFLANQELCFQRNILNVWNGLGRFGKNIGDLVRPIVNNDPLHAILWIELGLVHRDGRRNELAAIVCRS